MERIRRPTPVPGVTLSPTLPPPTPTYHRRETIKVGQTLPHLPLTFETGEEMTLMDYQHTTMIVNFTATWCQPCLDMLPTMNDLQVAYTPEQLQVISVMSFDDEVDFAALRDKFPLAYPLSKADVTTLPDDYDVPAIPLTLIVSSDHIIRAVFLGSKDQATLEAALEEWITTQ
jgi:peroxiredoxin